MFEFVKKLFFVAMAFFCFNGTVNSLKYVSMSYQEFKA